MLERYSPVEIKVWLERFLGDLLSSSLPMPNCWRTYSSATIEIESRLGTLVIRWREPKVSDRLKATFVYLDGEIEPFVSFVFDTENYLQELEIWRGDGKSLDRVPEVSCLRTLT